MFGEGLPLRGTRPDPGVDNIQPTTQAGWQETLYNYNGAQPHAVTSLISNQSAVFSGEYDANGNMTCRVENGVTYRQNYNAENRISSIAKINGLCSNPGAEILEVWAFAYDGDGTRVSTAHYTGLNPTPDSISAYYMGGAYEVTGGAVRKYYAFAGQIIAMKDGAGLKYLLTDHLGSVVAVTGSNGTLTSQQRYLPFGGVRTDLPSPDYRITSTDFGYTRQRKLAEGMGGIMDYKARFYSPSLGRFIQPDSIIPNAANPQSWNRYSYAYNSPINFNDPSGHDASYCNQITSSSGRAACNSGTRTQIQIETNIRNYINSALEEYGVQLVNDWTLGNAYSALRGVRDVANALANATNASDTSQAAFKNAFGTDATTLVFQWGTGGPYNPGPECVTITFGGCTTGPTQGVILITFANDGMYLNPPYPDAGLRNRNTVVHELGHLFGSTFVSTNGQTGYTSMTLGMQNDPTLGRPNHGEYGGFASPFGLYTWQMATTNPQSPNEVFADMFLGWTYDTWYSGTDAAQIALADNRSGWMESTMGNLLR